MRTTVSIDDELLLAAKRRARERAQTLGDVIDDALRRELADTAQPTEITVPVFSGRGGLRPGIDAASNQALLQALDEDQPIDVLR